MTASVRHLLEVRSLLAEQVVAYLDDFAHEMAVLPKYYPEGLREGSYFGGIRQRVAVSGSQSECPLDWDEDARRHYRRAVILGNPGFGTTFLLRYEAWRIARGQAKLLRDRTISVDEVVLPIFVRLSDLYRIEGPLEDSLLSHYRLSQGRSVAFRDWARRQLERQCCVVLLAALDEVPETAPDAAAPSHNRAHLGRRIERFARQFPNLGLWIACRKTVYPGLSLSPTNTLAGQTIELELNTWEEPQIRCFAEAWFGASTAAEPFLNALRSDYPLFGLARVPGLLAKLCAVFQEIPDAFQPPSDFQRMLKKVLRVQADSLQQPWEVILPWLHYSGQIESMTYLESMKQLQNNAALCEKLRDEPGTLAETRISNAKLHQVLAAVACQSNITRDVAGMTWKLIPPGIASNGDSLPKPLFMSETLLSEADWARLTQTKSGDGSMAKSGISVMDIQRLLIQSPTLRLPTLTEWRFVLTAGGPARANGDDRRLRTGPAKTWGIHDLLQLLWQPCSNGSEIILCGGAYDSLLFHGDVEIRCHNTGLKNRRLGLRLVLDL
ncbi:MAG: NACHT domain-containing protein [Methylococcales bacterium]